MIDKYQKDNMVDELLALQLEIQDDCALLASRILGRDMTRDDFFGQGREFEVIMKEISDGVGLHNYHIYAQIRALLDVFAEYSMRISELMKSRSSNPD